MVGGEVTIVTHLQEGTTVRVRVPAGAGGDAEKSGLNVHLGAFALHRHDDSAEQV